MKSFIMNISRMSIGLIYALFPLFSLANVPAVNLKMGNPTQEELTMTSYDLDLEAKAVILYNEQDVYYDIVDDKFVIIYDVKKRIKILKSEGTDLANVTIPYVNHVENGKLQEKIFGLKAISYNMENGEVVKTKMNNSQVFDERLDNDHMLKKFTIPQVKEGTVIEYEYKLQSEYYYDINEWYVQTTIPTYYTSYQLTIPEWFRFYVEQTGWEHLENQRRDRDYKFSIHGQLLHCVATEYTFIGKQLPAIHSDGFIWCVGDYITKVTTELSQVHVPNSFEKIFTLSWDDVVKSFLEERDFGGRLKRKNPLKEEMTAAGIDQLSDPQEKILATIRLLQSRVRWNGQYSLFASNQALKDGIGNNADMNFLLIQMLKDEGIEAFPVLLRRRDTGRIPLTHPTLQAFNTFIVAAPLGDKQVAYIDPSAVNGYLNVLPSRLLVESAYCIGGTAEEKWLNLQRINKGRTTTIIDAQVTSDGVISGKVSTSHTQNSALSFREDFKASKDSVTFVNSIADENDVQILSYQLEGHHDFLPKVIETTMFKKQVDATNGHIYLNPLIFIPVKESPFTDTERKLPVELPFAQTENINVRLALPEGYVVEEKPNDFIVRLENDGGMCRVLSGMQDDVFNLQFTFTLNQIYFSPEEYAGLKDFFDYVVQHLGEMLILKKES